MSKRKYKYLAQFDVDRFYFEAANLAEAENIAKGTIMSRVYYANNYPVTICSVCRYNGVIRKSLETQIHDAIQQKLD